MAQYPEEIASFRGIENIPGQTYDENKKTTLYTEDIQAMRDEIIEIESILGTTNDPPPLGVIDTLLNNQSSIIAILSAIANGGLLRTHIGTFAYTSSADFDVEDLDFQPSAIFFMWLPSNSGSSTGIAVGFTDGSNQASVSNYQSTRYSTANRACMFSVDGTSIHTGFTVPEMLENGFRVDAIEYTNNQNFVYFAIGLKMPEDD